MVRFAATRATTQTRSAAGVRNLLRREARSVLADVMRTTVHGATWDVGW